MDASPFWILHSFYMDCSFYSGKSLHFQHIRTPILFSLLSPTQNKILPSAIKIHTIQYNGRTQTEFYLRLKTSDLIRHK